MFDARIVTRELKLRTEKNWRLQYFLSMDYFNKFYFGETDYETPNRNEQLSSLEKAHELLKESGNLTDPKRLKPLPQEPGPQRYLRDVHVSLANQYILLKSPKKSIAIIKQLLIMPFSESNLDILNTNLAVAYLYNGDLQKCKNLIEPLKDREYNKKMTCKEMFIAKLDDFEKNGITHPDVNDMKKFLTNVIHSLKKK